MKYFVVIGLGSFGERLVRTLAGKGGRIIAADKDPAKADRIKDIVDKAVISDLTNPEDLEAIGVKDAEAVIVATGPDLEDSILIVHHLKEMGIAKIMAKANSEAHGKILRLIGAVSVILPETESALRVATHLMDENILDSLLLSGGFGIRKIIPPGPFVGKSIRDLDVRKKFGVNIIAIKEFQPKENMIVPLPDYIIKESDLLIISGEEKFLDSISAT